MFTTLVEPFAIALVAMALAIVFTRLWVNDTAARAVRELRVLGLRPGHSYKLGGAWALHAARERGNLMWAALSAAAWVACVVAFAQR
jgi:hypothetical protein